jgi:hypothetical protein
MVKALLAVVLGLSLAAPVVAAVPAQPKAAAQSQPAKPDWVELTKPQQAVLAPLKEDWAELDTLRRTKWVKVANAYPKMKPQQQQRLQAQMKEWASLTPEQRRVAREKYKAIKKLPPEKREQVQAQWQQYQQSLAAKPESTDDNAAAPATQQ